MICPACMEFTHSIRDPQPFHRNPNLSLCPCPNPFPNPNPKLRRTQSVLRQIDTLFIAKTNEIGKYQKCCELGAAKRLNKQTIFLFTSLRFALRFAATPPLPLAHWPSVGDAASQQKFAGYNRAQRCSDFVPFRTSKLSLTLSLSLCTRRPLAQS